MISLPSVIKITDNVSFKKYPYYFLPPLSSVITKIHNFGGMENIN